jgi:hypothetical protein
MNQPTKNASPSQGKSPLDAALAAAAGFAGAETSAGMQGEATTLPTRPSAPASAPEPKPMNARASRPLAVSQIKLAEYATQRHVVSLPSEVDFLRVEEPSFWANVTDRLRPGDLIDVHSQAGLFFGQLYVREAGFGDPTRAKFGAVVHVLGYHEFDRIEPRKREAPTHEVRFLGPVQSWGIVRLIDGAVVVENLPDRPTAEAKLRAMLS